jgi:hypothetical protein
MVDDMTATQRVATLATTQGTLEALRTRGTREDGSVPLTEVTSTRVLVSLTVGRGRGDSFAGQATPHANAVSPNSQSAHAEGKDKPFCFRCWKPGHGKLDCVAQLL